MNHVKDGLSKTEFEAWAAFIASSTLLQRAVEQNLQDQAGITQVQFEILMNLTTEPSGLRMADLADRLIVSRSGLTYQAVQLEKAGLIARARHSSDERGVVARITDDGEKMRQKVLPDHLRIVREYFFAHFSPTELATLTATLTEVADGLRSART
jgi:DNA-binding MarR family transcriptional regulator